MIKEIPKSDISIRLIKVYKEWRLTDSDIVPIFGLNGSGSLFSDTDEKSGSVYRNIIYESIKSQFYTNASTSSIFTEVGKRKSYASNTERNIENEFALIAVPQKKYGEGIKIGSVVLTDNTLNRTYTDDGYSNLIDSGSNIKGNIFYDRGFVIITKDVVSGSVLNSFMLNYRSTMTIYENEIFLTVLENEFNTSQNPTAVDWNPDKSVGKIKLNTIQSTLDPTKFSGFGDYEYSSSIDPTGSYLTPYITTIGLYDNEFNMVAVAKLPNPIKSLPDYPINFIVRLDT
jgi:hypothetical protein